MIKKLLGGAAAFILFLLFIIVLWQTVVALIRPKPPEKLAVMTGVVTTRTVETLNIRTNEGTDHTFSITGAVRQGLPGTFPGDTFTIWYDDGQGKTENTGVIRNAYSYEKITEGYRNIPDDLPAAIPPAWLDGGIFQNSYEAAYETLRTLTVEQRVGQLFLARFPGQNAVGTVNVYQPGGFVLFEEDFRDKTEEQIVSMLQSVQNASVIPSMFATDEEGGRVVRLSDNPALAERPFFSPQALFAQGGLEAVRRDAREKAGLLKKLGLHVNLAPVADVSVDPGDYIYERTIGQPAAETGDYAAAVVGATQESGLSAALKHFPGYGNNRDTHTGISVDKRPYSQFVESDFLPFRAGIEAGAHSVLVSHNIVECMDKNLPASLSPAVHHILRTEMGFTGVVMTDDLAMDAIEQLAGDVHPAVLALLAGNDLIVITDLAEGYRSVLEAVENGTICREQLNRAVFRILAWKHEKGMIS